MNESTPATSGQYANVNYSSQPRNMRLVSGGVATVPTSRVFPEIRGGQCEHCGTIDPNQPGHLQYKLCPHYRGMEMRCAFCPDHKDHEEVVRNSRMIVREHPYRPGTLVTLCGTFECTQKFEQAFKIK